MLLEDPVHPALEDTGRWVETVPTFGALVNAELSRIKGRRIYYVDITWTCARLRHSVGNEGDPAIWPSHLFRKIC